MNRGQRVETVLRKHPAVRDVSVFADGADSLQVLVVVDNAYFDRSLEVGGSEAKPIAKWRKVFDLTQLTKAAESAPVGFNTLGWNSSYTRKPLPADEMREWLQTTVEDILALDPHSVYEIGCGTGMLVMAIANQCERYIAADFAPSVIRRLREQLQKTPNLGDRVQVLERAANDFEALSRNSTDTVIINSVVQYFPNLDYLNNVLERSMDLVKDGGRIFVGDILNLLLLRVFSFSVLRFQSNAETTIGQLQEQVAKRIEDEQQLFLSPAYFHWLQSRFPRISSVEVQPRREKCDNEMSKFRYHAIIHIGGKESSLVECPFLEWNELEYNITQIRRLLQNGRTLIGLKNVKNARLAGDLAIFANIQMSDKNQKVQTTEPGVPPVGVHPHDLIELAETCGFNVLFSWKACYADGNFDAAFIPVELFKRFRRPFINWPCPDSSAFQSFANVPGQGKVRRELVEHLFAYCRENLSSDLMPCGIRLVDSLEIYRANERTGHSR
ncbi:MAG TPA: class I SAM-dependent methyltransferase [Candidatus Sulfotelmatobacter sp.]|nr:class I SAM-dependent methyltransferase [Candidatus Sulfotelmatobacter sp.]